MIDKIVEEEDTKEMIQLSYMLEDVICELKEYDHDKYDKYKMKLYTMANGYVLTDEMKMDWVEEMSPKAKWTYEEIESVFKNSGINMPISSTYVIMNMLYSDMSESFEDEDEEHCIKRYINATKGWYFDDDAKYSKEEKLFKYYFDIVK
jgi:hypothetical protein